MKWYVNPKCTHAFILHLFPMTKGLQNVLILYPLDPLMNFQINTWDSLQFKPINNLTMIYYHQNLIRRTLGLTNVNRRISATIFQGFGENPKPNSKVYYILVGLQEITIFNLKIKANLLYFSNKMQNPTQKSMGVETHERL